MKLSPLLKGSRWNPVFGMEIQRQVATGVCRTGDSWETVRTGLTVLINPIDYQSVVGCEEVQSSEWLYGATLILTEGVPPGEIVFRYSGLRLDDHPSKPLPKKLIITVTLE